MDSSETLSPDVQQLREENALLAELLQVRRVALANFMAHAARTLARVRRHLQRRTREPEEFQEKLARLHRLYAQLLRRTVALSLPSLAQQLESVVNALEAARASSACTGDALLPALVGIDAVYLTLTTIAQRTGVPLTVRRAARRRSCVPAARAHDAHAGGAAITARDGSAAAQ